MFLQLPLTKQDLPHPGCAYSVMPRSHPVLCGICCVHRWGGALAPTISPEGVGHVALCPSVLSPQALHTPGPAQRIHQHGLQPWAAASRGHTCSLADFSPCHKTTGRGGEWAAPAPAPGGAAAGEGVVGR